MDVERELTAALNVRPSPEFAARLRTRFAHSPVPANHRPAVLAALGVGLVAVAIVVALSPISTNENPSGEAEHVISTARPTVVPVPERSPAASSTNKMAQSRPKEPDVLVPAGEAEALGELFVAVVDGRADLASLADDTSFSVVEADVRGQTVIPPPAFELVQAATNLQGVFQ